ncbi:hypothetical protein [Cohnella sp. AR92]|uniref:glycoside hydrolase family 78 protein n=1 Tax=Cohnella sp. AR92 TaxID=648716 RepID=UPI000F8C52FE|nr:hypothetical protein [Cohnella sp. AR92]RUS44939.1 hypothetical protein ELR57_22040 [Cohnella sp. AR92]
MKKIRKTSLCILIIIALLVGAVIPNPSTTQNNAEAASSCTASTLSYISAYSIGDTSANAGRMLYAVGMFSYTVQTKDDGTWTPVSPGTTASKTPTGVVSFPYCFQLEDEKQVEDVSVEAYTSSKYNSTGSVNWSKAWTQSRTDLFSLYNKNISSDFGAEVVGSTKTGMGTSSVGFTVKLTDSSVIGAANPDYTAVGTTKKSLTVYFPMLLKIKVTPKIVTKYFDTSGNSLSSVFTNTSATMVTGQSYSGATPPTNANYTYYGYSKTTQDKTYPSLSTVATSTPPKFTYDGNYATYILYLYYKKNVPTTSGLIHVRHMVRTGSTGSYSKAAETEITVDSLPATKTVNPTTSYGTVVDSSIGYVAYSDLLTGKKSQSVSLTTTIKEAWVTFYYEKEDKGVKGDFYIDPDYTIEYGNGFAPIPKDVDVKSCTFNYIQFRIYDSNGNYEDLDQSYSKTDFYAYNNTDEYPSVIIGPGSYPVSMLINTSCGDAWVGPKTLTLTEAPPEPENNPPYAAISWFDAGTETHVISVAQGNKVDLKVTSMTDPDPGDKVSIVGWDLTSTPWLASLQAKYGFKLTDKNLMGITTEDLGEHPVSLTVQDLKGKTYTANALLRVIDPRPVAIITAPDRVKENHPLPSPIHGNKSYSPAKLPLVAYEWSENKPADGDTFHAPGIETLTLIVQDSVGRWSDLATKDVTVIPDEPPVVNIQVPSEETRTGEVTVVSEAYSPDGDTVVRHVFFQKYDAENNGFDDNDWVRVQDGAAATYTFKPSRVGKYLFAETAYEDYGKSGNTDDQPESERTLDVVNLPPTVDLAVTSDVPEAPESTIISFADLYANGKYVSLLTGGLGNKDNFQLVNGAVKSKVYKALYNMGNTLGLDNKSTSPYASIQGTPTLTQIASGGTYQYGVIADEKYVYLIGTASITAFNKTDLSTPVWTKSTPNIRASQPYTGANSYATMYTAGVLAHKGKLYYQTYVSEKFYLNIADRDTGELISSTYIPYQWSTAALLGGRDGIYVGSFNYPESATYWGYWSKFSLDGTRLGELTSDYSNAPYFDNSNNATMSQKNNAMVIGTLYRYYDCGCMNSSYGTRMFTSAKDGDIKLTHLFGLLGSNPKGFDNNGNYFVTSGAYLYNYSPSGVMTKIAPSVSPDTARFKLFSNFNAASSVLGTDDDGRYWFVSNTDGTVTGKIPLIAAYGSDGSLIKSFYPFGNAATVYASPDYTFDRFYQGSDGLITFVGEKVISTSISQLVMVTIDPTTMEIRSTYTSPNLSTNVYAAPIGDQTYIVFSNKYAADTNTYILNSTGELTVPKKFDIGEPTKDLILGDQIPAKNTISLSLSPSNSSAEGTGYVFFALDKNNYYSVEFEGGELRVKKTVNGTATTVYNKTYSFVNGKTYNLKIVPSAGGFTVYANKIKQAFISESSWSQGSIGIINRGQQGVTYMGASYYEATDTANILGGIALVNTSIDYVVSWDDEELDPRLTQLDQWTFTHNPNVFLNPEGTWSESGKTLNSPPTSFELPGDYTYTFIAKDDPHPEHLYPDDAFDVYRQSSNMVSGILRVHRPPIEQLDITLNDDNTLSYVDSSYDPDRYDPINGNFSTEDTGIDYKATKGILKESFRYQAPKSTTFIDGKPGILMVKGVYYIEHTVFDEYGAWDQNVYPVYVDGYDALPPIAGFTVTPLLWYRNMPFVIDSTASDPQDGDRTQLQHAYYVQNVTAGGASTLQSDSRTSWEKVFNSLGIMSIRQIVTNSFGLSAEVTHTVEVVNQNPAAQVTTPSSVDSANPTVFDTLRPTFTWSYSDADDDQQTKYQLRIYKYGGVSYMDSGEISSSATSWAPSSDLPENINFYVMVRVYDGYDWSDWSDPKYFVIITNKPPIGDFSWTPSTVYEGDTVNFIPVVDDPDKDPLTVTFTITSPAGVVQTFSLNKTAPYDNTGPSVLMADVGEWTAKMIVSDGREFVTVTKTVSVLPLTVTGAVSHTAKWNQNRIKYNQLKTGTDNSPWAANTFLAGEEFVLSAKTTDILSGSSDFAKSVSVTLLSTNTTVALSSASGTSWTGTMWNSSFKSLAPGAQTFRFTATYSNGVVKTTEVVVYIDTNTVDDYYLLVRDK